MSLKAGKMISSKYALLEAGKAPLGVHKGKLIKELPVNTLLYYADQFEHISESVYGQYVEACLDAAFDLGYIHEREKVRQDKRLIDLESYFIGDIGQRLELECVINGVYYNESQCYTTNILKCGNNIVKYFGASLGKAGETIKLKCTIKRHDVYKDIKSTTISRPKVI